MNTPLFTGELVRLAAADPEKDAAPWAGWMRDSEFLRLLDTDPAKPESVAQRKQDIEERGAPKENGFPFVIRTLVEDRLIGFVGLWIGPGWNHRNGWIGIGLGERDTWGRGYGTDAMRLIVRYGFQELDLYRITLTVFTYNPRAVRSYEKVGFEVEGRLRQALHKDGRRADILVMGLRRPMWERQV